MKLSALFPVGVALAFAVSVVAAGPEDKGSESSFSSNSGGGEHVPATSEANSKAHPVAVPEKAVAAQARSVEWESCSANGSVIEDLKKRQQDLDAREKELKGRDADLKAREAAMADEIKKLDGLRKDISGLKAARRQKNEEQVTKLIETIEKMSPKAAAPLLAKVDEDLAVAAMNGLSTDKLAKIMSNMDITRSIRLSELLAMGENAPVREPGSEGGGDGHAARP